MSFATASFGEAFTMTDQMPKSTLSAYAQPAAKAANNTVRMIQLCVLAVSVAAAIPTARNLYFSWKNGVPFNQVEHRLNQATLLERNFDCRIDYRAVSATADARVEVGACKQTGDISIKVTRAKQVNYEWIAFEQLPKAATQSASLMSLFIADAYAGGTLKDALATEQGGAVVQTPMVRVAQETVEVMCQAKQKDTIVRIVKEAGKCYRESVSIFKGTVEQREEVACDAKC
ncbi:MAG TPA: hypothetical protein PLD46_04580 [Hyphomicrobium sp.]|nr:hypothetical protein [Hyphomicrobium sp.]